MFYTILDDRKSVPGTFPALLEFDTCSAAQAAERVAAAHGCQGITVGKYLAFTTKYEIDRDTCYAAITAAGHFTDDKETTEYWLFNLMRLYHGDKFPNLRYMEGPELHRYFRQFLAKYLPDATYNLDLECGVAGVIAHLDFKFFLGDDAYHFMFVTQPSGTEQLILYRVGQDCVRHQIRIANPATAKKRIDDFIRGNREAR